MHIFFQTISSTSQFFFLRLKSPLFWFLFSFLIGLSFYSIAQDISINADSLQQILDPGIVSDHIEVLPEDKIDSLQQVISSVDILDTLDISVDKINALQDSIHQMTTFIPTIQDSIQSIQQIFQNPPLGVV